MVSVPAGQSLGLSENRNLVRWQHTGSGARVTKVTEAWGRFRHTRSIACEIGNLAIEPKKDFNRLRFAAQGRRCCAIDECKLRRF